MHEYHTDRKKGKRTEEKKMQKNEEERLRACAHTHTYMHASASVSYRYLCAYVYVCVCIVFYSLARNWINSLELPFYVRFALYSVSLTHSHSVCALWQYLYSLCLFGMPTLALWLWHAILIKMLSKLGFDLDFFRHADDDDDDDDDYYSYFLFCLPFVSAVKIMTENDFFFCLFLSFHLCLSVCVCHSLFLSAIFIFTWINIPRVCILIMITISKTFD